MNIILSNSAKFNPYTFDKMLKPIAIAAEAYNKTQEGLIDLGSKAELMKQYVAENPNSSYASKYTDYINEIEKQADSLNTIGLTPDNRQAFNKLRRSYNSAIAPIEKAVETRKLLAEEQRKLRAANPSLMFNRDFSTVDLQDLIDNPQLGYSSVSGEDIYTKGKEAGVAASSRAISSIKGLSNQYWQIRQGYSADEANAWLLNHNTIPGLRDAVDRIVQQSGVDENNKSRAIDYAISGIMAGMSYKETYQANRDYIDAAEQKRLELSEKQFKLAEKEFDLREQESLGIKLPDGKRAKLTGNGAIVYNPNNPDDIEIHPIKGYKPNNPDKPEKTLENAAKISDEPLVIAKTGGEWGVHKDNQSAMPLGWTGSNVINAWGNVDIDEALNNASANDVVSADILNNINELSKVVPNKVIAHLQKISKNYDLNQYALIRVKSENQRPNENGKAEPYDYILVPKPTVAKSSENEGLQKTE